jgi:hypothetical protein
VLTALGERDATIAATEQRAGAALQAMIIPWRCRRRGNGAPEQSATAKWPGFAS